MTDEARRTFQVGAIVTFGMLLPGAAIVLLIDHLIRSLLP